MHTAGASIAPHSSIDPEVKLEELGRKSQPDQLNPVSTDTDTKTTEGQSSVKVNTKMSGKVTDSWNNEGSYMILAVCA